VRSGDPFGFIESERKNTTAAALTVLPIVAPLTRFNIPARHPFGDRRAPRQALEDPSQIIGGRDYQPDDPLRRVHWKATARAGTLQSKVYPTTTVHTLTILLDIHTTGALAQGINQPLLELGIAAAASVAAWATAQGLAVGVFSNGLPSAGAADELTSFAEAAALLRVPPGNHPDQLHRILLTLARLQPYFGIGMTSLLAREEPRLPIGSTIIAITAAAALPTDLVARLERLARHGHQVALLLTGNAPAETGTLTTYRLGDEEAWNVLAAAALKHAGFSPDTGFAGAGDGAEDQLAAQPGIAVG
jgi:uncharacterized protein (DUF58 family)